MIHADIDENAYAPDGSVITRIANQRAMAQYGVKGVPFPYFKQGADFDFRVIDNTFVTRLAGMDDWIVDYPTYTDSATIKELVQRVHATLHHVYAFIYDVDCFRYADYSLDKDLLLFDGWICPSEKMTYELKWRLPQIRERNQGSLEGKRLYVAGPSAYPYVTRSNTHNGKLVFAGNLSKGKASFLNDVQFKVDAFGLLNFGLFNNRVTYKGTDDGNQQVLQNRIAKYSAGLVWDDGEMGKTSYLDYERYNWPCKFDMYLSAGIPVIVHKESNMAPFVRSNEVGAVVSSLDEVPQAFKSLRNWSAKDYDRVWEVGSSLGRGQFIRQVLRDILREPATNTDVFKDESLYL